MFFRELSVLDDLRTRKVVDWVFFHFGKVKITLERPRRARSRQTVRVDGLYLGSITRSVGLLGIYPQITAWFKALLNSAWVFAMTERGAVVSVFCDP